jgi:hypothetical protein
MVRATMRNAAVRGTSLVQLETLSFPAGTRRIADGSFKSNLSQDRTRQTPHAAPLALTHRGGLHEASDMLQCTELDE